MKNERMNLVRSAVMYRVLANSKMGHQVLGHGSVHYFDPEKPLVNATI